MGFEAKLLALIVSTASSMGSSREKASENRGEGVCERDEQLRPRGLVLKIVLGYSVKNHIELPQPSSSALSPFDHEHIVLTNYVLQSEITLSGIHGDPVFIKTPECERGIYISKDRLECKAEAGFSHPTHGVAVSMGPGVSA